MWVGGTTVLMDEWDTELLVESIAKHQATFTIIPSPPIVEFCAIVDKAPSKVESLVAFLHSSSKAPPEHLAMLVESLGPRLVEGLGMTENSGGLIAATRASDYINPRPDIFESTGIAAPDTIVDIIDEDGNLLPHDGEAVGQLVAHSGSLARGYWGNPEATAKSFVNGWYNTGDLGRITPDGYIYMILLGSDAKSFYVLYPNGLDKNNAIKAGQTVRIPKPDWEVKAAGPVGTNNLLVMVSDSPRKLNTLTMAEPTAAEPFTYALNDIGGRSALINFLTSSNGKSESFGAKLVAIKEVK
jgi:hypothetical protein